MSDAFAPEQFAARIAEVNAAAVGLACDDLEFRACRSPAEGVDVYFRGYKTWVSRVPADAVSIAILESIATAVRTGRAIGRGEGKREIGDFLWRECGL